MFSHIYVYIYTAVGCSASTAPSQVRVNGAREWRVQEKDCLEGRSDQAAGGIGLVSYKLVPGVWCVYVWHSI